MATGTDSLTPTRRWEERGTSRRALWSFGSFGHGWRVSRSSGSCCPGTASPIREASKSVGSNGQTVLRLKGERCVRGRRLDVQPAMSATLTPRILILPEMGDRAEHMEHELAGGRGVSGGVDPRISGEQLASETTRCRAGHQEVASRQAASRLLRCAPALRVT